MASLPAQKKLKHAVTGVANRTELSSSVLELGQRARLRREEERSKRPEIVVLKQAMKVPIPRQQKVAPKAALSPETPQQAPTWHREKSSVLRVDGLPEHCTPDMIRRFFSGFNPDRIVILPSLGNFEIAEWGERDVPTERIFVKFLSAPIAAAASQRSFETILHDGERFVIELSLVSKRIGNCVLQILAIDGIAGESLTTTREKTESNTQPRILHLLWTLVIRQLELDVEEWMKNASFPWKKCANDFYNNLDDLEAYRDGLLDELNCMERAGAILQIKAGDPRLLLSDAVVRFYDIARTRLHKEIAAATNLMLMARYENKRKLVPSKV